MNFGVIEQLPHPVRAGCGGAARSKGWASLERAGSRSGWKPEREASESANRRLKQDITRGFPFMAERLPRNLEKGNSSLKPRRERAAGMDAAEHAARDALRLDIAKKLRVVAGQPERPVQAAIERARQKLRWRSYDYVEDLWYGEIDNIPGHLCRQIDALAAKAASEEIETLQQRIDALKRMETAS